MPWGGMKDHEDHEDYEDDNDGSIGSGSLDGLDVRYYCSSGVSAITFDDLGPRGPHWRWVSLVGRDDTTEQYRGKLSRIGQELPVDNSLLDVAKLDSMVSPQVLASHEFPQQYLMVLRSARSEAGSEVDGLTRLFDRWMMIVDFEEAFIITLTQVDTEGMTKIRSEWGSDGATFESLQHFMITLFTESLNSFRKILRIQQNVIDLCESRMLSVNFALSSTRMVPSTACIDHYARSPYFAVLSAMAAGRAVAGTTVSGTFHAMHMELRMQSRLLKATLHMLQRVAFLHSTLGASSEELIVRCRDALEKTEHRRDEMKQLLDAHISLSTHHTSQLVGVLAQVSVTFMPLIFLTVTYNMKFAVMPELKWKYTYPAFWVFTVIYFLVIVVLKKTGKLF